MKNFYSQQIDSKLCLFKIMSSGTTKVYEITGGKLKFSGRIPF